MAFGRMAEPITPIEPPEMILSRRAFFEPIGAADTMAKYTCRLVADLCDRLEDAGEGALQVDLRFYRVDNKVEAIQVRTAKPVRDEKRLSKLLCDKIETVDPGFGIERMVLAATLTGPLCPDQIHATFGNAQTPDVDDLWDTLTNRFGGTAVCTDPRRRRAIFQSAPFKNCPCTQRRRGRLETPPFVVRSVYCARLKSCKPWLCCRITRRCPSNGGAVVIA